MKPLLVALAMLAAGCPAASATEPTAAPVAALPRYTMDIALAPATHELRVTGTLVVPAPGAAIRFQLMDAMKELELTSTPPGTLSNPSAPDSGSGNVVRTLTLAAPAREVTIRFAYVSHAVSAFVYYIGDDAMIAGGPTSAWYPQLAPNKAVGELRYRYPARYRMIAGGKAVDRVTGDVRTTTVAYPTPATFSFVAAELTERHRDGVVPMRTYTLRDRPGIDAYLDGCARVLGVLTREFGPYPYDGFALVELPDRATAAAGFGGASFEGFIVANRSALDAPFNLAYFGHELGHQWWGNLITGPEEASNMLTGEGLAQYGSLRVIEDLEGSAAAEAYRRRGYPGYIDAQSGFGYLRNVAAGIDEPVGAAGHGYSPIQHMLANSKGLLALDHLSRVVGRDRFRAALHDVTGRYAFRTFGWPEFRPIVEARAGRDLGATFAEWFDRTGAPDWTAEWTAAGHTVRGVVLQRGAPYHLDVEVVLSGGRDAVTRRIALDGPRTPFALEAPFDVARVELDPHFAVLHWTPEYHAEADALVDATRAYAKRLTGDTPAALALLDAGLARVPEVDRYGVRFALELSYGSLLRKTGDLPQAKLHLAAALAAPVRPADKLPWVYVTLAQIAATEHDRDAVARYAKAAVDAEAASGHPLGAAATATAVLAAALP